MHHIAARLGQRHCRRRNHEGSHDSKCPAPLRSRTTHPFGRVEIIDSLRNDAEPCEPCSEIKSGEVLLAAARSNAVGQSQHCKPTTQSTDAFGGWTPALSKQYAAGEPHDAMRLADPARRRAAHSSQGRGPRYDAASKPQSGLSPQERLLADGER